MSNLVVDIRHAQVFQSDQVVLMDVNLRISKGEFVYLIGKTGSGKTSLLKTIYGALPLRKGEGTVAGYTLGTLTRHSIPGLRRKLGIVFQDFNLLTDRTVFENLDFVLRATDWKDASQRNERIRQVLTQVGLEHATTRMPFSLSGGEQQRVAIARALLNSPELILADEPTGNLDPETSDDILLLLRNLAKQHNTAVCFATHDYRMLENFPARTIRCFERRILQDEDIVL